jgi:hypothetical protein
MIPMLEKQADANELELSGTAVSPFEEQKQLNRSYPSFVPAISSKSLWAFNLEPVAFSFYSIAVPQHIAGNPLNRCEQESSVGLEAEFNRRAERWIKDTSFQSSLGAKFMHEDYQTIMAMGTPVIPLILARRLNGLLLDGGEI